MNKLIVAAALSSSLSFAQAPAPAPAPSAGGQGMDMSKLGPGARKSKNEGAVKKELEAHFKKVDELSNNGDFNAAVELVDFPVFMVTDDTSGKTEGSLVSREQYLAMMKPMWDQMPKGSKMVSKVTVNVLSDALVSVTNDWSQTVGKEKTTGRSSEVLVKVNGQWKSKVMSEAGWGGMMGASAPAPAPAPAPAQGTRGSAAPAPAPSPARGAPAPAPAPR